MSTQGLVEAPALRFLCSGQQHASIDRAVWLLGLGTDALRSVGTDSRSRLDLHSLQRELAAGADIPSVVCVQAGEINTGAFDPFSEACQLARDHGAWVHVDGAFSLWAATSPRYAHLTRGLEQADSWTTDGHKWLNVPFDSGFAFVRNTAAHRAAMTTKASYLITTSDVVADGPDPAGAARDQIDWTPEWSRRGRAVGLRRDPRPRAPSIAEMIERCSDHADRLVRGIGALPSAELLVKPQINQGLVRFLAADGDHDRRTAT